MPHARHTDPQTSHDAAKSVRNLSEAKQVILSQLYTPKTDEELLEDYNLLMNLQGGNWISPSGLRSRRSELVSAGLVADSGERKRLKSGRNAIVWETVK